MKTRRAELMYAMRTRDLMSTRFRPLTLTFAVVMVYGSASAQNAAPLNSSELKTSATPPLTLQARVGVNQSWTDNNRLQSSGKDAALITTVSPGVVLSSTRGRVQGALDYSLNGIFYTKSIEKDRVQHALAARASVELVEDFLFIDSSASVSQQALSAFGSQSADSSLANPNQKETAFASISPRIKGRFAEFVNFELRANSSVTMVSDSSVGDSHSNGASLRLSRASQGALSWSVQGSTQKSSFKTGSESRTSSINLGLNYKPDVDWQMGVVLGHERSDLKDYTLQNSATYGANVVWVPSLRTKLAADYQTHNYGDAFSYSLEHRWARAAVRLSDMQSVNAGNLQNANRPQSNYDLYFFQFASLVPDPSQREVFVRNYLRAKGLSAEAISNAGLLNSGPTLQRNQLVSLSYQGVRTTVTATANRSNNRRLASADASSGDFAQTGSIRQRAISFNVAHALTGTSNALLSLLQQESEGDLASQSSTLKSISASWSSRLGARTAVTLGARAARFYGLLPYREHALFANIVQQF